MKGLLGVGSCEGWQLILVSVGRQDVLRSHFFTARPARPLSRLARTSDIESKEGPMASTTTTPTRDSHKKLKPKPKTENKSWQTRNMARKEKQTAHAAKLSAETPD